MSTMHLRHRRLLSQHRSTGLQVSPEAAAGQAQRHAQGWADQAPQQAEPLNVARLLMSGLCRLTIGLAMVGMMAVAGVWLFDTAIPALFGAVQQVATR